MNKKEEADEQLNSVVQCAHFLYSGLYVKATSQSWVTHLRWQLLVDRCNRIHCPFFLHLLIPNLFFLSLSLLSWELELVCTCCTTPAGSKHEWRKSLTISKAFLPMLVVWWSPLNGLRTLMWIVNVPHGNSPGCCSRGVKSLLHNPHHWWKWLSILECNSTPLGLALKIEK